MKTAKTHIEELLRPMTSRRFGVYIAIDAMCSCGFLYTLFQLELGLFTAGFLSAMLMGIFVLFGKITVTEMRRLQNKTRLNFAVTIYTLSSTAVQIILTYATLYKWAGVSEGNIVVTRPLDFLYFSIVTWTTLGYGDLRPSIDSRMIAASEALFGYVFMGVYLAVIFYVITTYAISTGQGVSEISATLQARSETTGRELDP